MNIQQSYIKELCTDRVEEAIEKLELYDQLEFCAALEEDGLTPSIDDVKLLIEARIPRIKIMIRCRPGNFEYSKEELELMKGQIMAFLDMGINNFVFGAIKNGRIDMDAMIFIANSLHNGRLCIHKAIDESSNILEDIKLLKTLQCVDEVLSSGGAATAVEGASCLKQMISAAGNEISIIAAGKITAQNLEEVHAQIGAGIYHGRKIV